jgi:hypothetical protein
MQGVWTGDEPLESGRPPTSARVSARGFTHDGSVPVGLASYRKLQSVQGKRADARAQKEERKAREAFAAQLRHRMRQRGVHLKEETWQQAAEKKAAITAVHRENQRAGAHVRAQEVRGRERIDVKRREWQEHGAAISREVAQFEIRKRATLEATRQKRERETIQMRADLKELKKTVDTTNLANARALVARVRADTAHDKIRLAKTKFVDARWDKADALRDQINAWKASRRHQELTYLANAVTTNAQLKEADDEAKLRKAAEIEACAEQVRREREELAVRQMERDAADEALVRAAHAAMQPPKVMLTEEDEGGGGINPIRLFGRLFGFGKSHGQQSSLLSPRQDTPRSTPRYMTPRRGATPRGTPRNRASLPMDAVRV